MKFLQLDSPVMRALTKMADLMWINILTIFVSLPIVTFGAAYTALHYCCLKIVRDEEVYITKQFFHSFKENFRQATVIWIGMLVILGILGTDAYLLLSGQTEVKTPVLLGMLAVTVLVLFAFIMVFPVLAKFANTIPGTFKNAIVVAVLQFPKTLISLVAAVSPFVLIIYFFNVFPLFVCFAFSAPAFLSALLYNKTFKTMEDRYFEANPPEEVPDEDEHIFSDAAWDSMDESAKKS